MCDARHGALHLLAGGEPVFVDGEWTAPEQKRQLIDGAGVDTGVLGLATLMAAYAMEGRIARVVGDVVARASRLLDVDRVWLFGSFARGTATSGSDVDIALRVPRSSRARWARFVLECQDEVPALVDLDLVDIDSCDPNLANEIAATGRVVYERER